MDGILTFLAQAASPSPEAFLPEDVVTRSLEWTQGWALYIGSSVGVYLILLFLGRTLKKRFGIPLGWGYHLFAVAMGLFLPSVIPQLPDLPGETHVDAAAVLTTSYLAISFLRHFLLGLDRNDGSVKVPKFLGQMISIILFLIALAIVLQGIYKQEVPGLLAGAGIVGIVLGLALQDTLGNIFAGFAIYFGGQFKPGDWLKVNDEHAEIMEINWRSTRLRTKDNVFLDIPNANITKETVYNYTHPTTLHAMRIEIGLEYDVSPEKVRKVLIDATSMVPSVAPEPPPKVYLTEFEASSITYQIKFWMNDHRLYDETLSDIRVNLWYALRRHNISIPYPIQLETSFDPPNHEERRKALACEALSKVFFAKCLNREQTEHLLAGARTVEFGPREYIIRQGQEGDSMYVLMDGQASVLVDVNGSPQVVASISSGDCIGEMSLLTGEKRSATILTTEETVAVQIDKTTLAPLIEENPELVEILSGLLAERLLKNEGVLAQSLSAQQMAEKCQTLKSGFLFKLRSFFSL